MYKLGVLFQKEFMKALILLFFIFFILTLSGQEVINQTDKNGLRQGRWSKHYPNGRLMYEGFFSDGKPSGEWKRFHENGALKAVMNYKADSAYTSLYDESGKLIAEGLYINELKSGLWILYHGDRKIAEENFTGGFKNGSCRKYYPTGELLEETEWLNGQQAGKSRFFFNDGKPYLEFMYAGGKRNGYCISYFPSGAMELDAFYKNDLKHNDWNYYNENGTLLYTLKYQEGRLLNPEVLDSLESKKFEELENQRGTIPDPENFLENPSEYLLNAIKKDE